MSVTGGLTKQLVPKSAGPVVGALHPPGSKSLTQRWLLLAALAEGESVIDNALRSDDVEALTMALRMLGAVIRWTGHDSLEVRGVAGTFPGGGRIDAREGGTPARFAMAAAALATRPSVIDGSVRLRKRPMQDGVALLHALGCIAKRVGEGELPLEITPHAAVRNGGEISIERPASSQFLSAVALIAPWMKRGLTVKVTGGVPSSSYVDLTMQCLRSLGVTASWNNESGILHVEPGPLKGFQVRVEPDASSAAYGFALAAMIPKSRVWIPGLRSDSAQPDLQVLRALVSLGAKDISKPEAAGVAFGEPLHGGLCDASLWPDGSLAVMAAAATANAPVEIRGLSTLAGKESDRIESMCVWLRDAGACVERGPDWIRVQGPLSTQGEITVATHRDHRLAMSAAVVGAVRGGVTVMDPACVAKSWPEFWPSWGKLLTP